MGSGIYYSGKSLFLALEIHDGVKINGETKYETIVFYMDFEKGTYEVGLPMQNDTEATGFLGLGTLMRPYAMPVRLCKPIQ